MGSLTEFDTDLELVFDQELICDSNDCENPGVWIRKHGPCIRVNCVECKHLVQHQLQYADLDEDFWCSACNHVAELDYWLRVLRFIPI